MEQGSHLAKPCCQCSCSAQSRCPLSRRALLRWREPPCQALPPRLPLRQQAQCRCPLSSLTRMSCFHHLRHLYRRRTSVNRLQALSILTSRPSHHFRTRSLRVVRQSGFVEVRGPVSRTRYFYSHSPKQCKVELNLRGSLALNLCLSISFIHLLMRCARRDKCSGCYTTIAWRID